MKNSKLITTIIYVLIVVLPVTAIINPAGAGITIGLLLVAVSVLLAILVPFVHILQHPSGARFTLISVAGLGLIFLIAYLVTPGEEVYGLVEGVRKPIADASTAKIVSGGIWTLLVVFGLAIVSMLYSELRAILK